MRSLKAAKAILVSSSRLRSLRHGEIETCTIPDSQVVVEKAPPARHTTGEGGSNPYTFFRLDRALIDFFGAAKLLRG
jgi:hypothetical protein